MKITGHDTKYHVHSTETPEWPMVLTPELRQQLLQEKINRVLAVVKRRDRSTHVCYETDCKCN